MAISLEEKINAIRHKYCLDSNFELLTAFINLIDKNALNTAISKVCKDLGDDSVLLEKEMA